MMSNLFQLTPSWKCSNSLAYLQFVDAVLEGAGKIWNGPIFTQLLLITRNDSIHLSYLVLQVQGCICPATISIHFKGEIFYWATAEHMTIHYSCIILLNHKCPQLCFISFIFSLLFGVEVIKSSQAVLFVFGLAQSLRKTGWYWSVEVLGYDWIELLLYSCLLLLELPQSCCSFLQGHGITWIHNWNISI